VRRADAGHGPRLARIARCLGAATPSRLSLDSLTRPVTQPDPRPSTAPQPTDHATPKEASLLQVASAVFWSFFGVRKGRHMQQDTVTIKPLHVIIVGLIAGLLFVLTLVTIVSVIVRSAG
jgi:hypothetical protein